SVGEVADELNVKKIVRRPVDLDSRHVVLHRDRHIAISRFRHLAPPIFRKPCSASGGLQDGELAGFAQGNSACQKPIAALNIRHASGGEEPMDFAITEEHRMMVDSVRQFREKELMPL